MDIYRLLPRTNCRECGYASCMAYTAQLREGEADLSQCPYLSDEPYAEKWKGSYLEIGWQQDAHFLKNTTHALETDIVIDLGVKHEPRRKDLYGTDAIESAAGPCSKAVQAGVASFNQRPRCQELS